MYTYVSNTKGVMIERGKQGTLEQVVEQGQLRLDDGLSIVLFPQGTRRIPTPEVPPLDFKRGFAVLAAKVILTLIYNSCQSYLCAYGDNAYLCLYNIHHEINKHHNIHHIN
jgi:1-acyl-sn-glycerol-3-phosphate acyltransferase